MNRLVVDAVAAYRLTRLVTADTITQPVRERWIEAAYVSAGRHLFAEIKVQSPSGILDGDPDRWQRTVEEDPNPPKLAELVTCRWCAGMWVSLGIVWIARRSRFWPAFADALALSAAAALVAGLEHD